MSNHLRFAGRPFAEQREAFLDIVFGDPLIADTFEAAKRAALPDWLIVSGALYNSVWNALTARRSGYGVKDIDLFYCDAKDLSWEAEDATIRAAAPAFVTLSVPVEIRNQARVHLWYGQKFGRNCPAYTSSAQPLEFFASKTHAVGLGLGANGTPDIVAPFGLDDIFAFRVTPNYALDNRETHLSKGARAKIMWPEITVVDW